MATHANPHTPRGNGVSTPRGPACIIHAFTRPLGVYRADYLPFSLGAGGQKVAFAWLTMAGCALRPPPQGRTGKGAPGLSSNPPHALPLSVDPGGPRPPLSFSFNLPFVCLALVLMQVGRGVLRSSPRCYVHDWMGRRSSWGR